MATPNASDLTEAELLFSYIGQRIANGGRAASASELMADFEEYYQQLQELRASLREAEASRARGESGPLDVEDVIRRGRERLVNEGITD